MYLIYFDENKYSHECPYFYVGGILLNASIIDKLEKEISQIQYNYFGSNILIRENELHGNDIFHGKGIHRKRKLQDRVKLIEYIQKFIISNSINIRLVRIDVNLHRSKYQYPEPEYQLGLMLFLERVCDFLDSKNDFGVIFGDYEKDEVAKSIRDFSQFKSSCRTRHFGRPLGRLIDTIYFTESHHSRFLQVADIIVFLTQRFYKRLHAPTKWHDIEINNIWNKIIENTDIAIQEWPQNKEGPV